MGDVSFQSSANWACADASATHGIHVNHCDRDKPPIQGGFCDITINEHPYSGVSSPDAGYAPSADRSLPPMANGN